MELINGEESKCFVEIDGISSLDKRSWIDTMQDGVSDPVMSMLFQIAFHRIDNCHFHLQHLSPIEGVGIQFSRRRQKAKDFDGLKCCICL